MPNVGTTGVGLTLCAILRVSETGIDAFRRYEEAVLKLLKDHEGSLQRRLRTEDGLTEIHVIWFPSRPHLDAYRDDPRSAAHAGLFAAAGAATEVLMVQDVKPG